MFNIDPATRSDADDTLVVPAWCDPKLRWFVWDASIINVGLLAVGSEYLAFATEGGLMFETRLSKTRVTWSRLRHLTRSCDLDTPDGKFRLYFTRPLEGAPRMATSGVNRFPGSLATSGTPPPIDSAGSLFGHLMALPGEYADHRLGQRNGDAVRMRLSH